MRRPNDLAITCLWLMLGLQSGCAGLRPLPPAPPQATPALQTCQVRAAAGSTAIQQTAFQGPSQEDASPFAGLSELTVEPLIERTLARNPSLAQMQAAWQAATARYPQVTSREDPVVGVSTAPGAWGSDTVSGGYRLEASQKFPLAGKLRLRGAMALAEAGASGSDVDDMRLRLIESAKNAFADYYLVARALAVNDETLARLQEFRAAAEALYKAPPKEKMVSLQDVYQTDVEIGRQQERRLTLERMRQVAVARINTLANLPPDTPLPPPAKEVAPVDALPAAPILRAAALDHRPDLRALTERLAADQAALDFARKEFYPDVEVMAAWDTFWQERPLRSQVGVRVNLPVRTARRYGAIAEAEARLAQRRAELVRLANEISFQVQEAYAQAQESERGQQLYEKKILPDVDRNVKTAQADYKTGQVPAVSVIEAERNRLTLYDRYYEIIADHMRRLAALERAVGGTIDSATPEPAKGIGL